MAVDLVGSMGYLPIFRHMVTKSSIPPEYEISKSASIKYNCNIYGNIHLGDNSIIDSNCNIRGDFTMGEQSYLGPNSIVRGDVSIGYRSNLNGQHQLVGTVDIGSFCAIAPTVEFYLIDHFMHQAAIQHDFYNEVIGDSLESVDKGPVIIKNDVWMGRHSMVIEGVKIGNGAIIGAGSIVTDDVEPYEIVAGVPAEHRGWRFPEHIRNELLEIAWWEWSDEKIQNNREFFRRDLTEISELASLISEP